MKSLWLNALLFQATWFACVLGAAMGQSWLGAVPLAMLALQVARRPRAGDLRLVTSALAVGLCLSWMWQRSGVLAYASPGPIAGQAPAWIAMLWVAFALTLNHSLGWLVRRPLLAVAFGLIGSPASYFAAQRLGAVEFLVAPQAALALIGVAWAATTWALARLALRFARHSAVGTSPLARTLPVIEAVGEKSSASCNGRSPAGCRIRSSGWESAGC